MGDILMTANRQPVFTAVSANGNAVFLSGSQVTQYQVGTSGPVAISGVQDGWRAGSSSAPAAPIAPAGPTPAWTRSRAKGWPRCASPWANGQA